MASDPYIVIDSGKDTVGTSWEVGASDLGGLMVSSARRGLIFHGKERDRFAEAVARAVTPGQTGTSAYKVEGKDGFDVEADYYPLGEWPDYCTALAAARARLRELDQSQPSAGGQDGIQDRVYVVHPDGRRERVFS